MLLAVLAAVVAVLIGPPLGVAAAQAAAPVYAYDYTVRLYEQPSNYATPGRASSIATFRVGGSARQPEIQYGSRGGEPGPSADGTAFAYNYEGTSHVFQHPNSPEAASVARGHSSVLQPDAVAAKTGDGLTQVGRWMDDAELAKMQKSGLVQERSGGRTFVTNPADPAAYPAGKGVFAEFNVPTRSLFPAGKPEWSVIPGPNVSSTRFGPPPSQMPPATCIVVVCRR